MRSFSKNTMAVKCHLWKKFLDSYNCVVVKGIDNFPQPSCIIAGLGNDKMDIL